MELDQGSGNGVAWHLEKGKIPCVYVTCVMAWCMEGCGWVGSYRVPGMVRPGAVTEEGGEAGCRVGTGHGQGRVGRRQGQGRGLMGYGNGVGPGRV